MDRRDLEPRRGMQSVSEGCRNCYAARQALRMGANPNAKVAAAYGGTAEMRGAGTSRRAVFTGRVNLLERITQETPERYVLTDDGHRGGRAL